jgi:hypothetical protein
VDVAGGRFAGTVTKNRIVPPPFLIIVYLLPLPGVVFGPGTEGTAGTGEVLENIF